MKYHDSIKTADKIMVLVAAQLKKWQLAINPINYTVVYEYYKKSNAQLTAAIEEELTLNGSLNGFFMENLYKEQVLEQSQFKEVIIADLSTLLLDAHNNQNDLSNSSNGLIQQLDLNIPLLYSPKSAEVSVAITALERAVKKFKTQTAHLSEELERSQKESKKLASELAKVRQEVNLDPVTGLFNQKAIASHIATWQQQSTRCNIAAIVIKIEKFHDVELKFGVLFSDIILSKIAHKIASYVHDSGLPVRLNYDEFILLLPEIDKKTATEIGIKITQGVQKMRFVSVKSDVKLPQINITFGVNHMEESDELDTFISETRLLLTQ